MAKKKIDYSPLMWLAVMAIFMMMPIIFMLVNAGNRLRRSEARDMRKIGPAATSSPETLYGDPNFKR